MTQTSLWSVSGAEHGELAVVGANGFLGQAVAREIARQGGRARLVARRKNGADGNEGASLDLALAGCEAVINCVGRAHVSQREAPAIAHAQFFATNCDLAEQICLAARSAGAARFVHVSSVAALASSSPPNTTIDDSALPSPENIYGMSKLAGDQRILALAGDDFRTIVLRPPAIFGPGARGLFPAFLRAARLGLPLPLARIANARSFAYVGNVANAVVHAARTGQTGAWIVSDSSPMSTAEFYALALRAAGKRAVMPGIALWILMPILRAVLGDRVGSLTGNAAFDGTRFRVETGWTVPWSPPEAMQETMKLFDAPHHAGGSNG